MLQHLKNEANKTYTTNGANAYHSTLNNVLDFFAMSGAARRTNANEICTKFMQAYRENAVLAMKALFFARDVRGGLGERRIFRIIVKWLAQNHPGSLVKNLSLFPEYGRFDDLLPIIGTKCEDVTIKYISQRLNHDISMLKAGKNNEITLLAKWLPSENASSRETKELAVKIMKGLNMKPSVYRKTLVKLRKAIAIIENNLRTKDYSFDYSKQPSKAMLKYRAAFRRNDEERYTQFLQDVRSGKATMHTEAVNPCEIVQAIIKDNHGWNLDINKLDVEALDTTWNALPDYTNNENALVVCDGSGSMYSFGSSISPAAVAQSLSIYFAEHNKGLFHNHFITFSERPKLVEIKGNNIAEKLQYTMSFNEVANTNLKAVFDLLLKTAVKNNIPQDQMPSRLYIISDMQFDYCMRQSDKTIFQMAKQEFKAHGYKLPQVVFWDVNDCGNKPVTQNEQGAALVSGYSPKIFNMINTKDFTPVNVMMEILNSERYQKIRA